MVVAVLLQREPLLEEDVLAEDVIAHLHVQLGAVLGDGLGLAQDDAAVGPLGPHVVAVGALHGGEQGEILDPVVLLHEGRQLSGQLALALLEGAAQQALLVPADGLKFDLFLLGGGVEIAGVQGEETLVCQQLQVNQHGVAREHAGGLVGALAVAGGAHGIIY